MRILVRSSSSYDHLAAAGAEPVIGDLKDADSLAACCTGVEAVVSTANSALRGGDDTVESVDRQGSSNLIDAASAAGVRHFVFTSVLGASPESPVPFIHAKGCETEQRPSGKSGMVLDRAATTGGLHGHLVPHGGRRPGSRRPVHHARRRRPKRHLRRHGGTSGNML